MLGLRESVNAVSVPFAYPYSSDFIFFEQYAVLYSETLQIILFAIGVVFIMTFLLIANSLVSILLLLGVSFSIVDIVGIMYFSGIHLNSVSVIVLSLAVGLMIDSAVHVGLGFMEAVGTPHERVIMALRYLGPPLIHGSASTFLAISCLAFTTSYVFQTFFKMFVLIIIFGQFHGIIAIPILLALFGPSGYYTTEDEKKRTAQMVGGIIRYEP